MNSDIELKSYQRFKEVLEDLKARRIIGRTKEGLVFLTRYGWELRVGVIGIGIPITQVHNFSFHNAELAHITIKSHRRSAYDLQRSRGKQRPIVITFPRFNPHPNFSMNGIPFLNLYSYAYGLYSTIADCYYGCYGI